MQEHISPQIDRQPMHGASFDVEDYRQILRLRYQADSGEVSQSFAQDMRALCHLLDVTSTRATFFVTGTVAQQRPQWLQQWQAQGHEIACHGWDHRPVWSMTPAEFAEDIRKSAAAIADAIGQMPRGYRAPIFSIRWDTQWALEVLADQGFVYDSSIVPVRTKRYGINGAPRVPGMYQLSGGRRIVEIPLPVDVVCGRTRPVGGGGYFRLWPLSIIRRAVVRHQQQDRPFVLYAHPDELGGQRFKAADLARGLPQRLKATILSIKSNMGRPRMPGIIAALLREFHFVPLIELAKTWENHGATSLLEPPRTGLC